jgi:hypothetical protein
VPLSAIAPRGTWTIFAKLLSGIRIVTVAPKGASAAAPSRT